MSGHTFLTAEQITELKKNEARIMGMDADIPCYSVGFSCEGETSWHLVQKTVDNFMVKCLREANCDYFMGFLTKGSANFRETSAKTYKYKGNRSDFQKPKWFHQIREYIEKSWHCQVMVGIEADDALAIAQTYFNEIGISFVMATLDKDLWQIVGEKLDWKTRGLFTINEEEAHRSLWKQVITGDLGTDNIPGLSHSAWKPAHDTMVPVFESEMRIPNEPKILASGQPSSRKMAHAKLIGYKEVAKKDQRALPEDLYGDVRAKEILDSNDPEKYPEVILTEYVGAYWEEAIIQGYEDPAQLGIERFEEVFELVYMLRTVDEIPNGAVINFVPEKATFQYLSDFDDEEGNDDFDPLSDFDDEDF